MIYIVYLQSRSEPVRIEATSYRHHASGRTEFYKDAEKIAEYKREDVLGIEQEGAAKRATTPLAGVVTPKKPSPPRRR